MEIYQLFILQHVECELNSKSKIDTFKYLWAQERALYFSINRIWMLFKAMKMTKRSLTLGWNRTYLQNVILKYFKLWNRKYHYRENQHNRKSEDEILLRLYFTNPELQGWKEALGLTSGNPSSCYQLIVISSCFSSYPKCRFQHSIYYSTWRMQGNIQCSSLFLLFFIHWTTFVRAQFIRSLDVQCVDFCFWDKVIKICNAVMPALSFRC